MATLINGTTPRKILPSNKNTPLKQWAKLILEAFKEREVIPGIINTLAIKHSWESGETPMAFVDSEIFKREQRIRNNSVRHPTKT
jgi:hypothetical protein